MESREMESQRIPLPQLNRRIHTTGADLTDDIRQLDAKCPWRITCGEDTRQMLTVREHPEAFTGHRTQETVTEAMES